MQYLAFLFQQSPAAEPSLVGGLLPVIAIIGIFYLLVFLPMQKEKKKQSQMLASLEAGNEVVTSGGIIGTIISINDDRVVVRVKPENIKLEITRSAVASRLDQAELEKSKK